MSDPNPHRDFDPDPDFEAEARRFLDGPSGRARVAALEQAELGEAVRRMDLDLSGDIRLPGSFVDADLDRLMERGIHLRFIPLQPTAREVPARWADLFEQSVPGPGWYAAYDWPLSREEIALRFMTDPPETVADYFKILDLVREEMPGDPRSPVVLANIPEILWMIKRNPQAFYEDELLLASAPAFPEAVTVKLDPHVEPTSRALNDPFDGAIYPLKRLA